MNTVFLGLGGNIGDRMVLLEKAVKAIESKIGRILKRSSVYESSPWGSSTPNNYLNMVIEIMTDLTAKEVLTQCLKIETILGRKRGPERYSDRTMDIDMLYYNELVLSTDELEIPHPRLHLRRFVLVPLVEIASTKKDPSKKNTVRQLLKKTKDTSSVMLFTKLRPRLICFDGNIGSGKTTLARALATEVGGKLISEPLLNTELLQLFYTDPKFALSLEFQLLIERYLQLRQVSFSKHPLVICDFSFHRSLEFAKSNLKGTELSAFEAQYGLLQQSVPRADLIIKLHCPTPLLLKNIAHRARRFEAGIQPEYIERVERQRNARRHAEENIPTLALNFSNFSTKVNKKAIAEIKKYLEDNFGG